MDRGSINTTSLIEHYLNTCFSVEVADSIIVNAPCSIGIYEGDEMDFEELVDEIGRMFAVKNARGVCKEWHSRAIREKLGDIFTFLDDCKVKLGRREWFAQTKEGRTISLDMMKEYFCPMYTEIFVEKFYNDWFMDQMIKETEKNMGFNY